MGIFMSEEIYRKNIEEELHISGRVFFDVDYNKKIYRVHLIIFRNDNVSFFEMINSIEEVVEINGNVEYIKIDINEKIITRKFLSRLTAISGCFSVKEQHRPPRKLIKQWLIDDVNNIEKENDIIYYDEKNKKISTCKKNRMDFFVKRNCFNLFYNDCYFYFENGFFDIIEKSFYEIEEESKNRHFSIDNLSLFLIFSIGNNRNIKDFLTLLVNKTLMFLDNNDLTLNDINRLIYTDYLVNMKFIAANFLYHDMKIDIRNANPRPVSVSENLFPLCSNISFTMILDELRYQIIPFSPKEAVVVCFDKNNILEIDENIIITINRLAMMSAVIMNADFIANRIIVIPSEDDYIDFVNDYIKEIRLEVKYNNKTEILKLPEILEGIKNDCL
jgi:hypothetical protein